MALNWTRFRELDGADEDNFERLVQQAIYRRYGRYGQMTHARNLPGVEFHLQLARTCDLATAPAMLGWQCKWYDEPNHTLNPTRKRRIEGSLQKAKSRWALQKWYLVTRDPFAGTDAAWVSGLDAIVEGWSEINLEELLDGTGATLREAYFGELVLTRELLQRSLDEALAVVLDSGKFLPALHVSVPQQAVIERAMAGAEVVATLRAEALRVSSEAGKIREIESALCASAHPLPDVAPPVQRLAESLEALRMAYEQSATSLEQNAISDAAREAALGRYIDWPDSEFRSLSEELLDQGFEDSTNKAFDARVGEIWDGGSSLAASAAAIGDVGEVLRAPLIVVVGGAGQGKTHLLAEIASGSASRLPGVLLYGDDFDGSPDGTAVARLAGFPGKTLDEFLEALDAAGARGGSRVPLVIDALNESDDPARWRPLLARAAHLARSLEHVFLVVSIRPDYVDTALPKDRLIVRVNGFQGIAETAIARYFEHYRIEGDVELLPLDRMAHPLYLAMYCEATNPGRETTVRADNSARGLHTVLAAYLDEVERRSCERLSLHLADHPIQTALDRVAEELWTRGEREIGWERARDLVDDGPLRLSRAIVSDGLLQRKQPADGSPERVQFSYDALAGHVLARWLVARYGSGESLLSDAATVAALEGEHPLAEDIVTALAARLPAETGEQLWQLAAGSSTKKRSELALFDLEAEYVDQASVRQLSEQFASGGVDPSIFSAALQTRTEAGHPLNARFLSECLRGMTVADRDLTWTEWVRAQSDQLDANLARLASRWERQDAALNEGDELATEWVSWLLTSTVRPLRDRATRALFTYGKRQPEQLFALALRHLDLNDPYVPERLLAASYGVAMAAYHRRDEFGDGVIAAFALELQTQLLAEDAPAGTTHFLLRDYAVGICRIALLMKPDLAETLDISDIRRPFRHPRSVPDPLVHGSDDWDELAFAFRMDFENYTVGRLVPGRRNYDSDDPRYLEILGRVRRRVSDLGWTRSRFEALDRLIAGSLSRRDQDPARVERYGKKYSWIAYYEAAGHVDDQDGLDLDTWSSPRLSDADIDPSFPEPAPPFPAALPNWVPNEPSDDETWLRTGEVEVPDELLRVARIAGNEGPWLAVYGTVDMENTDLKRSTFAFIHGLLVDQDQWTNVADELANVPYPGNHFVPGPPDEYYTYLGEIPWRQSLHRTTREDDERAEPFEGTLDGRDDGIPIEILAQQYSYESYHSVTNTAGGAILPSQAFALRFDLRWHPPSMTFVDPDGLPGALYFDQRPEWKWGGILYLREDLVRTYLDERGKEFGWFAWGERQRAASHFNELEEWERELYQTYGNVHRRIVGLRDLVADQD